MTKLSGLALMFTGAILGCAIQSTALAQGHGAHASPHTPSELMHASMNRMSARMAKMKMTGDVDRDFAMMMAEHHMGAIEMAQIELAHGKNARLKAMAKKMIADQKMERAELLTHAKMQH